MIQRLVIFATKILNYNQIFQIIKLQLKFAQYQKTQGYKKKLKLTSKIHYVTKSNLSNNK